MKEKGNIDSEPVESSQLTRENACLFTENFYDWDKERITQYMDKNSKNGICYIEFNYKQIGMDEKYFKEMVKVLEGNRIKIKREVLLQRIRGAADSPFNEDDLLAINNNKATTMKEIVIKDVFIMNVYEEIHRDYPYILSVDPSTGLGVGSDNTAINIIDPYTLRSIAVMKTPYADAVETSQIIVEIVMKIVPKCMLVIERNSLGSGVIAIIARTPVAANMYYNPNKVLEFTGEDKLNRKGYLDVSPASRRYWGVLTSEKNRNVMLNELLTEMVANHKNRFIAPELIDDLNNLYVKSSGRIEARPGKHDDVVMSYMIGIYVYQYGENISQWGLNRSMQAIGPIKEKKAEEMTYNEIYASLPDNLKEIFPSPNDRINLLERDPETAGQQSENTMQNSNKIFEAIQRQQAARRQVLQADGTNVVVRSNVSSDDMVRQAAYNDADGGISDDIIDICNLLSD